MDSPIGADFCLARPSSMAAIPLLVEGIKGGPLLIRGQFDNPVGIQAISRLVERSDTTGLDP